MDNFVDCLERWSATQGDKLLYRFLDSSGETIDFYTYRQFHERTNYVAAQLQTRVEVQYDQPVLLVYEPGLEVLVAFVACLKLGALPVPVAPLVASGFDGSLRKISRVIGDAEARLVLASRRCHDQLQGVLRRPSSNDQQLAKDHGVDESRVTSLPWIRTDDLRGSRTSFAARINPIMFLQYTSGSTEDPRGVMVSHENAIHNGNVENRDGTVGITWLPHYHDMGMIGYYLNTILAGSQLVAFSNFSFMRRPLLWFEAITRYRGTITSAPNFAYEYMTRSDVVADRDLASFDLTSVRCMMNASEPVDWETLTRFADRYAACGLARQSVTAAYGLAEATLAVSHGGRRCLAVDSPKLHAGVLQVQSPENRASATKHLVSCGKPLEGLDVRIVDPHSHHALGERQIGEVWMRGPSKTHGYWNNPQLTAQRFEATLYNGKPVGGFLRTGDLGFFDGDELFICGRLKDVIIIHGKNYYPHDIESLILRHLTGVRPGCVTAFPIDGDHGQDALAVVVEVKPHRDLPDAIPVVELIRKHFRIEVEVFAAVAPGSTARTSSGKIARHKCRQRWEQGQMNVLAQNERRDREVSQHLLQDVLECIETAGADDVTLLEAGFDSLALVSLSHFIRQCQAVDTAESAEELFDLRMLQTVRIGELRELIHSFQEKQLPTESARLAYLARLRALESGETEQMRADCHLVDGVAISRAAATESAEGFLLLTGGTGSFGGFLLDALLRQSDRPLDVVVRARDDDHARRRILQTLERMEHRDETFTEVFARRVRVIAGDLSQPQWGIDQRTWERLGEEASAIYHCGATVDYVRPYAALRQANVLGTEQALRLACEGRPKPFHLVSTTFIFGWSAPKILFESDCNATMEDLDFGYAQSKWVAEQLAFAAADRGLPVFVYRASLLTASQHGAFVRRDITVRVLSYMIQHGVGIDIDNQISFLPADVAAENLIALSLLKQSPATSFHLTADDYYNFPTITEIITRHYGYEFEYLSIGDFVDHINRYCTKDDLLYPLVPFFNKNYRKLDRMSQKRYDNRQYRAARAMSACSRAEPPLEQTVGDIVDFLIREGLVPRSAPASP